jgi:hypothetical protein
MLTISLNVHSHFIKVDTKVIQDNKLSVNAKMMFTVMHSFKVGKNASNGYFMKVMNVSESTVTRTRKELIKAGLLEIEKISKREYRAFLGNSRVSGLEVKRRYYKDELHST